MSESQGLGALLPEFEIGIHDSLSTMAGFRRTEQSERQSACHWKGHFEAAALSKCLANRGKIIDSAWSKLLRLTTAMWRASRVPSSSGHMDSASRERHGQTKTVLKVTTNLTEKNALVVDEELFNLCRKLIIMWGPEMAAITPRNLKLRRKYKAQMSLKPIWVPAEPQNRTERRARLWCIRELERRKKIFSHIHAFNASERETSTWSLKPI